MLFRLLLVILCTLGFSGSTIAPVLAADCCCYRTNVVLWEDWWHCQVDCTQQEPPELCKIRKRCEGYTVSGKCKTSWFSCLGHTMLSCGSAPVTGEVNCDYELVNPADPNCVADPEQIALCINIDCPTAPPPGEYHCNLGGPCCDSSGDCS